MIFIFFLDVPVNILFKNNYSKRAQKHKMSNVLLKNVFRP